MKRKCEKCHCELTAQEISSCTSDVDESYSRYICNDCWVEEGGLDTVEPDNFSDADPGL